MKNQYIFLFVIFILSSAFIYEKRNHNSFSQISKDEFDNQCDSCISIENTTSSNKRIDKNTDSILFVKYSWDDLKIKPLRTLEGSYYTFTAFEIIDNTLVMAISTLNGNIIRFFENEQIIDILIDDIPLDMIYNENKLFVLGLQKIYIIENKEMKTSIKLDISNITTFDKLIYFDNFLHILMSDGSSYQLDGMTFKNNIGLKNKYGNEIWIQKTSINSFEVNTFPNKEDLHFYKEFTEDIGSITLLGNSIEKYFCIVEIIEQVYPLKMKRILTSNEDGFNKKIMDFPIQSFSFIKNDIKVHNKALYAISTDINGLTLKTLQL